SSLWRAPTFRSRVARLHGTSPGCRYPSIRSCTPRTNGAGSTLRADSRACSPARSCGCGRQGNVSLHEGERQLKGWERTAGRSVALTAGLRIPLRLLPARAEGGTEEAEGCLISTVGLVGEVVLVGAPRLHR